jgi:hypothetical protein
VAWPLPELDDGVEDGELRPLDDELLPLEPLDVLELPELPDVLEPLDLLVPPEVLELLPDVAWCVLLDADDALAAPGRLNATAPAAIRLAAVAETVAARSRVRPRSRAATADCMLCGGVLRGEALCLLMPASLAACRPTAL